MSCAGSALNRGRVVGNGAEVLAVHEEGGHNAVGRENVEQLICIDVWTVIESQSNSARNSAAGDDTPDRD